MAIVEEIVIEGDASSAERAWRGLGEASKQSLDKMTQSTSRANAELRGLTKAAEEKDKMLAKLNNKFGATSLAMGAIAAATLEANKALGELAKMAAESIPKVDILGSSLGYMDRTLIGLKETLDRTDLNLIEKAMGSIASILGMGFSDEAFLRFQQNTARTIAAAEERARQSDALMALAEEGSGRLATTNLLASSGVGQKFADIDKRRREEAARMVEFGDLGGTAMDALVDAENARAELLASMEQDIGERLAEIGESNFERRVETENKLIEMQAGAAEERKQIAEREAEAMQQIYGAMGEQVGRVLTDLSLTAFDALFAMAEGQSVNLEAIANQFLKQTGRQLVAAGTQHAFQAAAMGILSIGANPQAYALATLAAAEMATGGAMMAGSLAFSGEGTRSLPSAGGAGRDFAGGGRSRDGGQEERFKDETIVINVNGVLTSKEAGREIMDAVAKTRRKFS